MLLKDQHKGYISGTEFERNQRVIANNATGKGSAIARAPARHGELLLAGLLRSGHCGGQTSPAERTTTLMAVILSKSIS